MAVVAKRVKAKLPCCKSSPRCKRCLVVLKRLERDGSAKQIGRRAFKLRKTTKKALKAARAR
jgi:hypothetical protein